MRRPLTRRIKKLQRYEDSLDGTIIYVDSSGRWCNVNIAGEITLYRIPFDEGVHPRLRRQEQHVTLTMIPGNKTKYVITGASRRIVTDTTFAPKGGWEWDAAAPDDMYWNDGHVWE